jgi:methyl coenzyme M reductase gamma subunit
MQLPGGVTISGRQILEDANNDLEKLMTKFREEEEIGPNFFIG